MHYDSPSSYPAPRVHPAGRRRKRRGEAAVDGALCASREMDLILPYKIGDLAESRSFVKGYRGAWFHCKINDMRVTEWGHFECYLEYTDYPGENKEWISLFQKNPACSKQQSSDQIMIRPSFPQWHWKDQVPEEFHDNDVVALVYETWKVGDMVDWLSEGCYWSGKITKLLSEDMLQVELLKPPIGEGKRYDANRNDLRPTLDWSLAGGWTVPLSQAKGKSWCVAQVVHHKSTESEMSESEEQTSPDDGDKDDNGGDSGDSQDVQLHVISSNTPQEAPGSPIMEPSSAAKSMSSLNSQDDATLTSMAALEPSSSSKSRAHSDSVQPAVTSSQPGIGIIEQEQGTGSPIKQQQAVDVRDQYLQRLQKLDEIEAKLEELLERTQSMDRRAAALYSFHWFSLFR